MNIFFMNNLLDDWVSYYQTSSAARRLQFKTKVIFDILLLTYNIVMIVFTASRKLIVTTLISSAWIVLLAACSTTTKQKPGLLCNISIVPITPVEPVFLAGFANRSGMSDTIHRPLRSKCIVLRQDTTIVCLVFNDLMEVAKEYDDRIRGMIADSTGTPVSHIFIMSSHSHSTPIMDAMHLNC